MLFRVLSVGLALGLTLGGLGCSACHHAAPCASSGYVGVTPVPPPPGPGPGCGCGGAPGVPPPPAPIAAPVPAYSVPPPPVAAGPIRYQY